MKSTDTNAGRYHSSQNIPVDKLESGSGNYTMARKQQSQEEMMQRVLETMARIEKAAANDRRAAADDREAAEEARRQTANQLSELVRRVGKLETLPGADVLSLPPPGPAPVTDEEAQVPGAKFWVVTNTGGKRTAHEVIISEVNEKKMTGGFTYEWERTDGMRQGPREPRIASQLFRTEEDAAARAAAPPSSARNRKVSISMKTAKKTTLPSSFGRGIPTTTIGSDE